MVQSAWFACIALAILPLTASAEGPAPPEPAGADALGSELPVMGPRLLLSWPIEPKRVSFSMGQPLWLGRGPLELRSFARVEQSAELDCRLTCQPVLERSLDFEARWHMGSTRALPENYLFAKGATLLAPRVERRLDFGLGGLLDF